MNDLKRWNRAGLDRIRYVGGNAATFLETLRTHLEEHFPHWRHLRENPETAKPIPTVENENQRRQRLEEQYAANSGEWGWEIMRVLARAGHTLGETLDAYANEGYIRTATQWEYLRRLVALLDYHPAPPASASTTLVFDVKEAVNLDSGFAVKFKPEEGDQVIFETLEELVLTPEFNALRPADHDISQDLIGGNELVLAGEIEGLIIGEPIVLEHTGNGTLAARTIQAVVTEETQTTVTLSANVPAWKRGEVLLHAVPKDRLSLSAPLRAAMITVFLTTEDISTNLIIGEYVHVADPNTTAYRPLKHLEGRYLWFQHPLPQLDLEHAAVSQPGHIEQIVYDGTHLLAGNWQRLLNARCYVPTDDTLLTVKSAQYKEVVEGGNSKIMGRTALTFVKQNNVIYTEDIDLLLIPPESPQWPVSPFLFNPLPKVLKGEKPKKSGAGDLVVVIERNQMAHGRLESLSVDDESGVATFQVDWSDANGTFSRAGTVTYSAFKEKALRILHWDRNLEDPYESDDPKTLMMEALPESLESRRTVVLFQEDDDGEAIALQELVIEKIESETNVITFTEDLPLNLQRYNIYLNANAVAAGHGESKPTKVLGSGDASRSNQAFLLEVDDISFVADATKSSGVAAALVVQVGDQTWAEVATLATSEAGDPHYTVRLNEDGQLRITFGDGKYGRRLPTGRNNIRVTYRVGSGLVGNLDAGGLVKAVRPNDAIDSVRQPFDAKGGGDLESADSLRENAPATVLTMNRAVAPQDFAHLASALSSVWQARAFTVPGTRGRSERLEVVVVPAGGGSLGAAADEIRDYLNEHAIPGVALTISDYEAVLLAARIVIYVKSEEYDTDAVLAETRAALLEAFSLENRKLGVELYRAELYQVVEGVSGVSYSDCFIEAGSLMVANADLEDKKVLPANSRLKIRRDKHDTVQVLKPTQRQVIHFATPYPKLAIQVREYQL